MNDRIGVDQLHDAPDLLGVAVLEGIEFVVSQVTRGDREVSGIARAAGRGRGQEDRAGIPASERAEREYAETAAALAEKQELSAEEAAEPG